MWQRAGLSVLSLGVALLAQGSKPTQAAEKIIFSFGATVERSISVDSLERFAKDGEITDELAPYLSYIDRFDPRAREQLREVLIQRADLDVVTVAQFAYTPQGEYLLSQAGEVFRTGARLSGQKGLRGAAIVSAADRETGLTILNVVRNFPTPVLRVDIRQGVEIANQVSAAFQQSDAALELIQQIALENATDAFPPGQSAGELLQLATRPGPFTVRRLSIRVKASTKPVDVYLPQLPALPLELGDGPVWPAVVISHGLGSDRTSYAYLAQFLAQHGFAVINVEHRGSSGEQLAALVSGRTNQVVPDQEFVDRPLLISRVLDELAELPDFQDKNIGTIDFNNVGIVGQSFGGYTALALAGAPINYGLLDAHCPPAFSVNLSLLLQCQAIELDPAERFTPSFKDPRIKAVVAINPIISRIFGRESMAQIEVPVLVMTGSRDTVAPALPEQVRPFTWLTMVDRYLLVMEGATHFSTIGLTGRETIQLPSDVLGPVSDVSQRYTQVMSMAFLNTYLRGDLRYRPILTSAFTTRFSQPEMPLSIIANLDPDQLALQLRLAEQAEQALPSAFQLQLEQNAADELTDPTAQLDTSRRLMPN
ncbi:MAG: alpha/beta fold hydrolase [Cyanobacteria bacterium J06554_11]